MTAADEGEESFKEDIDDLDVDERWWRRVDTTRKKVPGSSKNDKFC